MKGMHAITGLALEGVDHLAQSIARILTTPVGTRVMRRDFGSLLPALVDQPFNGATRTRLYGATAMALMRWEPRISLTHVSIDAGDQPGAFVVTLEGRRNDVAPPSELQRLTIPLNFA